MTELSPHPDLAGYAFEILGPGESEVFERHLCDCETCRADVAELEALSILVGEALPAFEVPSDLEARTFARIERHARGRLPSLGVRLVAAAALVAMLLVAAGLIVRTVRSAPSSDTTIRLVAVDGRGRGTVHLHKVRTGEEVNLSVESLPPTPAGRHYELWFVGPGDSLQKPNRISAGSLVVGADGKATARMFSAASPALYPKVGITDEPNDGDPARTGPKLLTSQPAPLARVRLRASLRPEEEVLAPGPPGAAGSALLEIDATSGELCYTLTYTGIGQPMMAHIHEGLRGVGGRPVLVDLG